MCSQVRMIGPTAQERCTRTASTLTSQRQSCERFKGCQLLQPIILPLTRKRGGQRVAARASMYHQDVTLPLRGHFMNTMVTGATRTHSCKRRCLPWVFGLTLATQQGGQGPQERMPTSLKLGNKLSQRGQVTFEGCCSRIVLVDPLSHSQNVLYVLLVPQLIK